MRWGAAKFFAENTAEIERILIADLSGYFLNGEAAVTQVEQGGFHAPSRDIGQRRFTAGVAKTTIKITRAARKGGGDILHG